MTLVVFSVHQRPLSSLINHRAIPVKLEPFVSAAPDLLREEQNAEAL